MRCATGPLRVWRLLRVAVLRTVALVLFLLPSYALLAYVVMPASWHLARLPQSEPAITYTAEAIPADPLNVALVGSCERLAESMRAAGWLPADRITFSSGWRDARSVLFNRSYPTAPMSTHYFRGRPQDLAFEQQVGRSPRRRHHVRFWRLENSRDPEKTVWVGSASFDAKVGVSRFTGEVMHHIDPAVDKERDRLLTDLEAAGVAASISRLGGFRRPGSAHNGGGDRYFSDGGLGIAVLCP